MGQEIHTFSLRVHNGSEKKGKQGPEKLRVLVFWIKDLNVFLSISWRSVDRSIVYCMRCYKPQESLPVHLARVCMKTSTPEERQWAAEGQRIHTSRTWDYRHLCEILPDRHSRLSVVKELLRRGFFIKTQPDEPELVLDPVFSTTVTTSSTEVCQKILKAAKADFLGI